VKWIRIPKENSIQPDKGSYSDWKQQIADEGQHQCVYCAIHDGHFGGLRNFHIEHYRPKSIDRFAELKNVIINLFYACPVCNTFKSDDWPADPIDDLSIHCYPDPSLTDYSEIFSIEVENGTIIGNCLAARYMVEKIYLNRPQLIMERRVRYLLSIEESLRLEISDMLKAGRDRIPSDDLVTFYEELTRLSNNLHAMRDALDHVSPYREADVERPPMPKKIRVKKEKV